MAVEVVQLRRRGWGETMRRDAWWVQPAVVFLILSAFLAYATVDEHYDPLKALVRLFRRKPQ